MGWWHVLQHWLAVHTGTVNESGVFYGFFSGFGSIVIPPMFTVLGISLLYWRHHNCHEHRCWRIGRHQVDGTPYTVCRRHHPELHGKPEKGHIHKAWKIARAAEML